MATGSPPTTTLFDDANPERVRKFFDEMMGLGVEGYDDIARLQLSEGAGPTAFS